ncbi:MAG: efflux RND transporter periplasmic adaptor subunit, partial [Saprospiraceae bacterium]|nr:efflux RND transporter periplasmic adaptor subunit [Saprospiraceae bacterium]
KLDTTRSFKKILVSTKTISPEKFKHTIDVQGHVTGDQLMNVSPQVPAVYSRIFVTKGALVTKGQILATLDDNVMRQGLEELKNGIEFAKTVYEKQKALWDQKIGSEIQYLTAKNNLESLNKKMTTMNQQLAMYKLRSPINGVVDDVFSKEGEMGSPGMPSIRVVNLKTLKVVANLAEVNIDKVKPGNRVEVTFPDLNKTIQSTVKTVGKVINELNRTFTVDIVLPTTPDYRPNMLCIVKILDYQKDNALAVPINSLGKVDNESFVYVVEDKDGVSRASKRKVELGLTSSDLVEIKGGLKGGEKIITVGYQDVNDGDAVEVAQQ